MSRAFHYVLLIVFAVTWVGCQSSTDDTESRPGFVNVQEDDSEMMAAIETAQKTFPFFEQNWKTIDCDGYSVKFAMPTPNGAEEHIWFSPTEIQADQITGVCANDPVMVPGLEVGDTRTVARESISDWMIVIGNRCIGGYTIRVLSERNPDEAPPLQFEDPPTE